MEVITCHFNPCKYKAPVENYWKFREALGVELKTVELSFDGSFEIPDALHITGNESNLLWQKERLLNILIEQSTAEKIAWVDADILFENPTWYEEAEEKLDNYHSVQLIDTIDFLDSSGNVTLRKHSCMGQYCRHGKGSISYFPGAAWAARKTAIPGGLLDQHVVGGGDVWMLYYSQRKLAVFECVG